MDFKDDDIVIFDDTKCPFKIYFPTGNVYVFSYVKKQKEVLRKQHGKEVIFFDRYRLATPEEIKNCRLIGK